MQVTVPDAQYEYFTHVEHADVHADEDVHADDDDDDENDDDYEDEDEDEDDDDDDDYVDDNIAINGEDFGDRDEIEDKIEQGDFRDFERDIDDNETLDGCQLDADIVLSVQNITDTIPAYSLPALSFSENTWENLIDPSHIETPFVFTWREGMNLCKGLTFANKVEVQRVLTKCALKENKHFMISRSTTTKLCAKCVDEGQMRMR